MNAKSKNIENFTNQTSTNIIRHNNNTSKTRFILHLTFPAESNHLRNRAREIKLHTNNTKNAIGTTFNISEVSHKKGQSYY